MRKQLKKRGALPTARTGQTMHSPFDSAPVRRGWAHVPSRRGVAAQDDDSALPTSVLLSARAGENVPHELSRLGIKRIVAQTGLHLTDFEVSTLMKGLDVDGNNTVPLELLQSAVLQRPPGPSALGASTRSASGRSGAAYEARHAGRPHSVSGSLASPIKPSGSARLDTEMLRSAAMGGSMGRAGVMLAESIGEAPPSHPPRRSRSRSRSGSAGRQPYANGSYRRPAVHHQPRVAPDNTRLVTTKQLSEAMAVTHPEMGQTGFHNLKPADALREVQRRMAVTLAQNGAVVDAATGSVMDDEQVQGVLGAVQRRVAAHIGTNDPYALANSHLRAARQAGGGESPIRKPATQLDREEAAAERAVTVGRMHVDAASTQAYCGAVPAVDPEHVVDMVQDTLQVNSGGLGYTGRSQVSFADSAGRGSARGGGPRGKKGGLITRTTALRHAMGTSGSSRGRPTTAGARMQRHTDASGPALLLDFDSFVAYTRRALGLRLTPANLRSIFDLFDTDGRGRVNMLHVVRSSGMFVSDDPSGGVKGGSLSPEQQRKAAAITEQIQADEARRQARSSTTVSPGFPTAQQLYGEARSSGVRSARGRMRRAEEAEDRLLRTVEHSNATVREQRVESNGTNWEYRSILGRGKDGWLTSKRPSNAAALARQGAPSVHSPEAMQEVREALSEHAEGVRSEQKDRSESKSVAWPSPPAGTPVHPLRVREAVEGALGDTSRSDAHRGTALLNYVKETRPTAGVSSRVLTGEAAAKSSARAPTTENEALHRAALEEVAPTVAALARDGAMRSIGTTPSTPPRSYRRGASSYAPTTDERAIARAEAREANDRAAARAEELREAEVLESLLEQRENTKARMADANRAADAAAAAADAGSTLRSTRGYADPEHEWNNTGLANTGLKRDGVHLFDRIRSPYLGAIPRGPAAMPELNHRLPTPPERSDTARSTEALAFVFATGADAEQQPGKDANGYGPRPTRTHHDSISSSGPAGTRRRSRQLQQALDNGGRPVGRPPRQYAYITVYNAVGKPVRKKVFLPEEGTVVSRDFGRSPRSARSGYTSNAFASSAQLSTASLASTQGSMSARSTGRRVRLPGESGALAMQQQRW